MVLPELAFEAPLHLPQEMELDAAVDLQLSGVDLPSLSAYFNGVPRET